MQLTGRKLTLDDDCGWFIAEGFENGVIPRGKALWESPGGMPRFSGFSVQALLLIFGVFLIVSAYREIATACGLAMTAVLGSRPTRE